MEEVLRLQAGEAYEELGDTINEDPNLVAICMEQAGVAMPAKEAASLVTGIANCL